MKLGCAVITAPRKTSYLEQTVRSLAIAGIERVQVYAEPGSDTECLRSTKSLCESPVTYWTSRRGNFRNWMESARRMVEMDHDLILMAEDDVLFGHTSISDATACWSFLDNPGFLSLYTPTHYQRSWLVRNSDGVVVAQHITTEDVAVRYAERVPGYTAEPFDYPPGLYCPRIDSLFGALGLVFSREVLSMLLENDVAKFWKDRYRETSSEDLACVDCCIGEVMQVRHLKMWYFNPGRAQHLGETSSLDPLRKISPLRISHNAFL